MRLLRIAIGNPFEVTLFTVIPNPDLSGEGSAQISAILSDAISLPAYAVNRDDQYGCHTGIDTSFNT